MKLLAFLIGSALAFAQAPRPVAVTNAAGAHSVSLTWSWAQAPGDPASGFTLSRSPTSGGPYVAVGTLACASGVCAAALTPYALVDPTANVAGQTYCFVVQATAAGGVTSANSNESCVKIPTTLQAPTALAATAN